MQEFFDQEIEIQSGLEQLFRRLNPGQVVNARVIKVISEDRIILRIWGYNFVSETHRPLATGDEVKMEVLDTHGHLTLCMLPVAHNQNLQEDGVDFYG